MTWLELSVTVDQEAAESVSELLARYGYNGGVVVDQPFKPGDEGPEFEYDTARPVTLRTYLPVDEQSEETRARIEQALWHLGQMRPVGPLQVQQLEEEDWANAWKRHYGVQRIGARTVIVPSWLDYEPQPHEVVLHLDPGMAFGTGLHPTTQLCVRLLEQHVRPGQRTLDLGAGSGILAIAAAKLGARPVLALDNDPIAVDATVENVARNGGDALGVTAELGSLGAGRKMGHWLSGDFGTESGERGTGTGERGTESGERGTESGERGTESGERGTGNDLAPTLPASTLPASTLPASTLPAPTLPAQRFALIVANLIAKVLIIVAHDLAEALEPGGTLITSGIIADKEDQVALALAAAGLTPVSRHVEGEWVALVHTNEER
jgi:ribosomal protein L11 methyltransferase